MQLHDKYNAIITKHTELVNEITKLVIDIKSRIKNGQK